MKSIRIQLLNHLLASRDQFLSGAELSEKLSVSRTAIWKHIEELRKEGYVIEAVRKKGYKIVSIPNLVTNSTIQPFLKTSSFAQKLYVYAEVDSTQEVAQKLAREGAPSGTIVIADRQAAGKGRLGRKWFSPSGSGLWMSLILRPDIPINKAPQLTLLTAVALAKEIERQLDEAVSIKWPNDLLLNGKKVAGILTELHGDTDRIKHVIIGVGLNVNQVEQDFPPELSEIATSLRMVTGSMLARDQLVIGIIHAWEELYLLYLGHGFSPIKTLWESYAVSIGKRIRARTIQGVIEGYAEGITDEGVLLVQDARGTIHKIYSADVETI